MGGEIFFNGPMRKHPLDRQTTFGCVVEERDKDLPSADAGVFADPLGNRMKIVVVPHGVETGGGT